MIKPTPPAVRYLQVIAAFSDSGIRQLQANTEKTFRKREKTTAYEQFVNWQRKKTEVPVFTLYAFEDMLLPKAFDCIFSYGNPGIFIHEPYRIVQSIADGWFPSDIIGNGYKHLCVLSFSGGIPDLIKMLPVEHGPKLQAGWNDEHILGLCNYEDFSAIAASREKQIILKQRYGNAWIYHDENEA